jgi:hypothetical protein
MPIFAGLDVSKAKTTVCIVSTAETKCVAATVQRCIRWRDEKGPARGPSGVAPVRPDRWRVGAP